MAVSHGYHSIPKTSYCASLILLRTIFSALQRPAISLATSNFYDAVLTDYQLKFEMRRSLAPSQKNVEKPALGLQRRHTIGSTSNSRPTRSCGQERDANDMVIGRMPLFDFLEIPDSINQQFRLPQGCVVTKE